MDRWCIYWEVEKRIKYWRARAATGGWAVARGRSDLVPNIFFQMVAHFGSLSSSLLLTAYKSGDGWLFQVRAISLTRIANNTSPSQLLRAQRECESEPLKSPSAEIHLHGCASDQIFGERIRDCSCDPFNLELLRLHPVLGRLSRATRVVVLLTTTVRGTARRTSSYIDFVRLHRTNTRFCHSIVSTLD
jgi:hypothetical protein